MTGTTKWCNQKSTKNIVRFIEVWGPVNVNDKRDGPYKKRTERYSQIIPVINQTNQIKPNKS